MPHATRPGDVLAGRYRLVDLLSESGDGRFWRAHDRALGRHVAIHVIRSDDRRAPALMEAARESATVLDRRILRVLDADVTEQVCYVVNEWGWGTSLDIVATGTGPLAPRHAAWLVSEVADSIATAHDAGIHHGRLNPENVLIDRTGGVRIIGLCVDAALHGVPHDDARHDLTDLAGLLHCALTATWGGASSSIVKAAPREHGEVLRPRRVRAGVPRPLDGLCDDLLHPEAVGRHRELEPYAATARGVADFLADFVGDATGMAVALQASTPPVLPDEELVVLPQVPEMTPHDSARLTRVEAEVPGVAAPDDDSPGTAPDNAPDDTPDKAPDDAPDNEAPGEAAGCDDRSQEPPNPISPERPTEAGLPIFGDDDDVSWLERRTTPVPPPPPFEEPPERPLFAPEPSDGRPVRERRTASTTPAAARPRDAYWPWDAGTGHGPAVGADTSSTTIPPVVDEAVPGRSTFRLAGILSAVLLLAVAIIVAINLNQGPGSAGDDPTGPGVGASSGAGGRSAALSTLPVADVSAFDPLGTDGAENDDAAGAVIDGDPATTWTTQGYVDQFGPAGLKAGVGLVLDLGSVQSVSIVEVGLVGSPTSVAVFVGEEAPSGEPSAPVAEQDVTAAEASLELTRPVEGRYVTVWLTSLPRDGDLFRGTITEVAVRGEAGD